MCMWIMTTRGWRPWHASNKPCPNSNELLGVYRPISNEKAIAENSARADRWSVAMQEKETRLSRFSGDNFDEPITGAFGEKL